jgi:oligosaccharyl transferase complex subunit OST4
MISDSDLYKIAIFLGTTSMVLIVAYHYLEVNAAHTAASPKKVQQ